MSEQPEPDAPEQEPPRCTCGGPEAGIPYVNRGTNGHWIGCPAATW